MKKSRKRSISISEEQGPGQILQPVFSDIMEFEKFARGKKLRLAKIPFDKLPTILIEQAEALVINPMGFNLILNRDQLKKING